MARWKANNDGTGYYDPNDSGNDQYTPTEEERNQYERPPANNTNNTSRNTGINGGAAYPPPATQGWQNVGHDGVYNGQNREQWRDSWMRNGSMSPEQANEWLRANGAQEVNGKSGVWTTPHGETLDLQIGRQGALASGGSVRAGWTDIGANGGQAGPPGGVGNGSGSGSASGAGIPGGASGSLYDILMKRATQSTQVDPNDPNLSPAVNAFRAEQDRAARNYISDQAEASGPLANLSGERRMANERAGQATAQMRSQLMLNELTARRQEISQALAQMGGMLSEQQRLDLQGELGRLNAGIEQQRVNNQNSQFLDQFGLNATDRANYWDAVRSGLLKG